MEVKWSDSVEKLVGINLKKTGDAFELNQHLLVEKIIRNY